MPPVCGQTAPSCAECADAWCAGPRRMGFTDETVRFNLNDGDKNEISNTLTNVYRSLAEKGYNPINQIVGYVLSGDPAYVPRYNDARNQIRKYERDEIVEELVRYYLKGNGTDL